MRKLLGGMAVSSFCLILGLGITGCSSSTKGKFAKTDSVTLEKMGDKKTVDFTKDVDKVTPDSEGGVKATTGTKSVTFELTTEPPTEDKTYKFKVKGKEKDEAEITVKVVGKKGGTPGGKTELTPDMATVNLSETNKTATVTFTKGEPKKVVPDSKDGVTTKVDGKTVVFTLTTVPDKMMTYTFTVEGTKDEKAATITVNVAAKVATIPAPGAADELTWEKAPPAEIKVDKTKDVTEKITFSKGKVEGVDVEPKGKGVTATFTDNSVTVTVSMTATPGEYTVTVKAKDNKKSVPIKLKVS